MFFIQLAAEAVCSELFGIAGKLESVDSWRGGEEPARVTLMDEKFPGRWHEFVRNVAEPRGQKI